MLINTLELIELNATNVNMNVNSNGNVNVNVNVSVDISHTRFTAKLLLCVNANMSNATIYNHDR